MRNRLSIARLLLIGTVLLHMAFFQSMQAQWPPPAPDASDWREIGVQRSGPFELGANVSAVGPSGGIYVAGRVDFDRRRVVRVVHWTGGGWLTLGDRFENGTTNVDVYAIAVDAAGNVYVSGNFLTVYNTSGGNPDTVNRIARWNVQTNAWEALGGGINPGANHIAVLDTNVYVGGLTMTATNPGGGVVPLQQIGFWSTTTNTWSPVGQGVAGGFSVVMSMVASPAGVYVGGNFLTATNPGGGQITVNHIALWTGTQWQPLGQGVGTQQMFGPYAANLALNAANELFLGGVFQTARNTDNTTVPGPIVRWNGTVWSNESAGLPQLPAGTTFLNDMVIDGSDVLCVYYYDNTVPGNVLVRRVAPGQWQQIGRFSGEIVSTLAGRTGRIAEGLYVGGLYNRIVDPSTNTTHDIVNNAQWIDGTGWAAMLGAGGVSGTVRAFASTKERPIAGEDFLYAGGSFTSIAGINANNVAEYDGTDWESMGGGVNGPVYTIVADRGGVYVGGSFTVAYNPDGTTVNVQNIALWDKQFRHWRPFNGGVTGPVYALEVYSNSGGSPRLFVGGSFNQAYDGINPPINANSIVEFWTQFSGPVWEVRALGGGVYGGAQEVRAIARHGDRYLFEHEMYLGGSFTGVVAAGGAQIPTSNIARWNIQSDTWRAVGQGVNGTVRALAYDFGTLPPVWVGGDFTISTNENGSTVNTPYMALWNDASNQWNILQGGTNGPVHAIARIHYTHYNGAFVGGNFTLGRYENGNTRLISHVGLFVTDQFPGTHLRQYWNGRPDSPDPLLNGTDGPVYALLSLASCYGASENLYAGGDFARAGNRVAANNIARWNYKWQPQWIAADASGGVRSSGGGNAGRGVRAVVRVPLCSPLVTSPQGEERILFDSLGFGASVQLDSLPFLEYYHIEVYREGTSFNPIYVTDSLFLSSASPGLLAFIGVDDTLDFASNPDGRSTEFRVIAKPLPIAAGQDHLARVVFLHAISDAPAINISVQGGSTLIQNLPYGETSDSTVGLLPGIYVFEVRRTSNNQLIGSFPIDLSGQAGQIAVVAAAGFLDPAANQNGPAASLTEFETGVTILTDVDQRRRGGGVPAKFALMQNYPNPFNPSTTIVFTLPSQSTKIAKGREREGSHVSLKVYDLLGREVATLVNEVKQPGEHTVTWDAQAMATGVYFYKLQAGNFVQTKKLLLLR